MRLDDELYARAETAAAGPDGPPFVEFELPAGFSFDVTVTAPGWEDPIQSSLKVGDKARQLVIFAPGP